MEVVEIEETSAAPDSDPIVTATVAERRSVDVPVGKKVVGHVDNKPIGGPVFKRYHPGQSVELPRSEVAVSAQAWVFGRPQQEARRRWTN